MPRNEYEQLLRVTLADARLLNMQLGQTGMRCSKHALDFFALCGEQMAARLRFLAEHTPPTEDEPIKAIPVDEVGLRRRRRHPNRRVG